MNGNANAASISLRRLVETVAPFYLHPLEVISGVFWLVVGAYFCITSFRWPADYYGPLGPGLFGGSTASPTFFLGAQLLAASVFLTSLAFLLAVLVPPFRASKKPRVLETWPSRWYWVIALAAFAAMWLFNWWAASAWLRLYTD